MDDVIENIHKHLQRFIDLREPSTILSDHKSCQAISYLLSLIEHSYELREQVCLLFCDQYTPLFDVLTNIFSFYYKQLYDLAAEIGSDKSVNLIYASKYDTILNLLYFFSLMTNLNRQFSRRLHESKFTKVLALFLTNDSIFLKKTDILYNYNISLELIYSSAIENILNLSKISDGYPDDFEDIGLSDVVSTCLPRFNHDLRVTTLLYMILINVAKDDEITELRDIRIAIEYLTKLVSLCKVLLEAGGDVKRLTIEVLDERGVRQTASVCQNEFGLHLYELITSLISIAVNDKIKIEIYETYRFKEYLEVIILKGNHFEKACAAKLLWQLCFAEPIAKSVYDNMRLFEQIERLAESETNFQDLQNYCQGILWLVKKNENIEKREEEPIMFRAKAFFKREPPNHIMISYNSESRELCLKIKRELESQNHKVWIDVENIHGSSLESMAQAVEDSKCVLICATEKYKQSPNCRAEAEYAFKLKKPFIPLIMQPHYSPDGWLGIIFGSKIYINFKKYDFQEACSRLCKEVNLTLGCIEEKPTSLTPRLNVESWSVDDVNRWLQRLNSNSQVATVLKDCNGHQLKELKDTLDKLFEEKSDTIDHPKIVTPITPLTTKPEKKKLEDWSVDDVEKWVRDSNIDSRIAYDLQYFTGCHLKRLRSLWKEAPDYFYQSISRNHKIPLLSVLNFAEEFEKLF